MGDGDAREAGRSWTVREYRDGDGPGIVALFQQVFGPRDLATWEWQFRCAPAGAASIVVAEADGRIVGHTARLPMHGWIDGVPMVLAVGADAMVDPGFRGQLISPALNNAMQATNGRFAARVSFPSDRRALRSHAYAHSPVTQRLPQWVRWLRPSATASPGRRALEAGAALMGRATAAVFAPRYAVAPLKLDREVDELAERCARVARIVRRRDADYLRWRWLDRPGRVWQLAGVRGRDGRLAGMAVWGPRPRDPALGAVVDLLAVDPVATVALLAAAARDLADRGHREVTLDISDTRPWAAGAFRRAGFLRRGLGPNVGMRVFDDRLAADRELWRVGSWYLTAGDTDLV